ncbi:MAG: MBL fold metallo-hydrolase [bacterium]|nr:MBL fold metallo-hydrolase [bacterium]
MLLTFLGAVREVTGSNYLLETENGFYLVDCGIFQGKDEEKNDTPFEFPPSSIRAILLTHAHLDHSGRIPKLVKEGFRGKIYATLPTIELCEILWLDTVKLMKEETERINRKNKRSGKPLVKPLYDEGDVEASLKLFEPVPYDEVISLEDIRFRFRDSAHILGSASIEVWNKDLKIVFSGDIGQWDGVMEGTPAEIEHANYVVIESTYGDRNHKTLEETRREFIQVIQSAIYDKGKVLIPSFVVDRAQRILYEMRLLKEQGILPNDMPIYFDSPMGKKVTDVYRKYSNLLSSELQRYYLTSQDPFDMENLKYLSSVEESKRINDLGTGIIIAGSGMCTGGRILHHIKHSIWKDNTQIIFVGYQAQDTLGRKIVDGAKNINVMGEELIVKAKVHTINGFSSHADQKDLLRWVRGFQNNPVFVITHGELNSSQALSQILNLKGYQTFIPVKNQKMNLLKKEISEVKTLPSTDWDSLISELDSQISILKDRLSGSSDIESFSLLKAVSMILREIIKSKS